MELLRKISKKYLLVSFSMLTMMGIVSCEGGCSKKESEEASDTLELSFVDAQLQGVNNKTKLTIKATKATKLEGLKLVGKLTTTGTAAAGAVKLTGRVAHTVEVGKESTVDLYPLLGLNEGDELKEGDDNSINIEFVPSTEQDLTFAVGIKNGKEELVGSSKTVEWKAKGVQLAFTTPMDDSAIFEAENEYELVLKNNGEKVDSDALTVELVSSSTDVTFTLGGKADAYGKNLSYIIGGKKELANNEVIKFNIQKAAATNGKTSAKATIAVKYNGVEVAKRAINWQQEDVALAFAKPWDDTTIFTADNPYELVLENTGDKVDSNALTVELASSDADVTFTLGGKADADGKNLSYVIGSQKELAPNEEVKFSIQKAAVNNGKTSAKATIVVKYNGFEVTKREITWKDANVNLVFITPTNDTTIFTANNEYELVLKNTGDKVDSDQLLIEFVSSDGDVTFTLGGKNDASGKDLSYVIGGKKELANNEEVKFKLQKAAANNGKTTSKATIVVKYKGVEVTKREIIWQADNVTLAFITPTNDTTIFTANNPYELVLKNTGDKVDSDALIVGLTSSDGDVSFTLGGKADGDGKNLSYIRNSKKNLANNEKIRIKLQKAVVNNGKTSAKATIVVKYKGVEVAKREIIWQAENVTLAFDKPVDDAAIFTADNAYEFVLNTTGDKVDSDALTVEFVSSDGDVTFTLGGKNDANGKSLSYVIGAKKDLVKNKRVKFRIKKADDNGKTSAKATIVIKYKGIEVAKRAITWKKV